MLTDTPIFSSSSLSNRCPCVVTYKCVILGCTFMHYQQTPMSLTRSSIHEILLIQVEAPPHLHGPT